MDTSTTSSSILPKVDATLSICQDTATSTAIDEMKQDASESDDSAYEVTLEAGDDPQQMSKGRKWCIVLTICSGAVCATCASTMASFAENGVSRALRVGQEVSILGVSLFILGIGCGPLLVAPLSEVHGRNWIYRISYTTFFIFSWPVAFPPQISVYLIFRFLSGFCSSAFLSVAGGTISDMFENSTIAAPMAVFSLSPFLGPVFGPLISGFINENAQWQWTFRVIIIWTFVQLVLILVIVPETYTPIILQRKAKLLRKTTGDARYWAPQDKCESNIARAMLLSCYVPFKLVASDMMALSICLWAALVSGIQYLTFQAFPIIFEGGHGFDMQETGLSFLGMGLGLFIGLAVQPLFDRHYAFLASNNNGKIPPEARLLMGQFGAVLIPFSLYCIAFTTYRNVPWILPVIASIPMGTGIHFCFTSMFTFLVTAYRPVAASAMGAITFVRTASGAAAFPLFANQMYARLGTVGATALLAGLTTIAAPLPFIFRRFGAKFREKSRFSV